MGSKLEYINNFVKIYRSLIEIPSVTCAQVVNTQSSPDLIKVSSVWSQRNIEQGEITKFQKSFVIKAASSEVVFESTPSDVSTQELTRPSGSEKFSCVVRKTKQDNKKKQFIEIWTQKGLFKNFDVSAFDVHGEIYCDGEFGALEWSPNEDSVLYIAEKKVKKSEPFYKQKSAEADNQKEEKPSVVVNKYTGKDRWIKVLEINKYTSVHPTHFTPNTTQGENYIYKPDWGEQLVDKHQPVIGICDIKSETLKVLEGIPPNYSPGQVLWSKDGKGIYGIVLENEPRRLGLMYCTNRLSYVFHLSLKGEFKILSAANTSVRSPRLSPDGKSLFWLQRPVTGVHNACQELVRLDLATNKIEVSVNVVRNVGKNFSGLFLHSLPARCFSKDGTKLFFSSCNKLRNSSYYLDLGTKEVHLLDTGDGSSTILDVHDDIILISSGSLERTPSLKMSKSVSKIEWISLTKPETVCENSVLKEMEFESKTGGHKYTYYNALYYGPPAPATQGEKVPLVLNPHGGPHSAWVNDYALEPNFFVKMGFAVLMVNYRGSTGTGQDGVEFLPGKIGDTDVKDSHEAVTHTLKNIPYLDAKNVFLFGGSHGGFLVGHLSAQYPDFYRAVVTRNPVTDVSAMYFMSDIPDWATGECGMKFDESKPLTVEQINKMMAVSPNHLAEKVKAPILFMIGKNDLRVPYFEGIKMYNVLKARKLKVRLHLYEDNHTLGGVPHHIDCLINAALWFMENKA